jgi:formamidopyrimidine-DNA glycosylase
MPELPEVETVRRTLEYALSGEKIHDVILHYAKIVHEDPQYFIETLKGQTLHGIERAGKYLLFILDKHVLIVHLRMEGKFYIKHQEPLEKHEHVTIRFQSGRELRYHDVRKFGTMDLRTLDNYLSSEPVSNLGPEPKDLDPHVFYQICQKKSIEIKPLLLDQTIISGLGNIYVDETLFRSHVHPTRIAHTITKDEAESLIASATYVLNKATSLGGTTIRSYTSSLGVSGKFQNELMVHMRKGSPCPVCGQAIIKMKVKGRGTYVCEHCQH